MSIFGVPWDRLELDHVRDFLEGADDEPLLWEAKGGGLDRHHVRKNVCGFANSHEGGYLILGAAHRESWTIEGHAFPDEPAVWVGNIVVEEIRPRPAFDVRTWGLDEGDRHVAVVRVEPTSTPPCITRGTVYERIPGKTIPVKEPQRLADLFARGDAARTEAQEKARRVREAMLSFGPTPLLQHHGG